MARFFIDRPVFAMVIAIVTMILGGVAIPQLPIATYPEVVPPVVQVTATYRGGNAQDLERTVAQPVEQQLSGLDGMLYFLSRSSNDGVMTIDVTFDLGTDVDTAVVQTQNKVNLALPALPPEVQREGITVKKVSPAILMGASLFAEDDRYDQVFLNNYATINLLDRVASVPGVGEARLSTRLDYGMRLWVDPAKMATLAVTAPDIVAAVQVQNRQNAAGAVGQPPIASGTAFQYPVNSTGRLLDPAQFSNIVLRAEPDGSLLRLGDIARVQLGAADYKNYSRFDAHPSAVVLAFLSPGANAVETGQRIREVFEAAAQSFPPGLQYRIGFDTTRFVRAAVSEVVRTLFEAIVLVVLVVFLFLQSWRATLIPLLAVPVSVIGTFALFPLLGFSINMTSLFGLVLAIGIVVDDAIVVVEAVQHKIDEGLDARTATIEAMREVSGPVVAIALILAAVFIPVSFLGGISGTIFRQFALTIAVSVLISAFNALTLSPALSAMILRPKSAGRGILARPFAWFDRGFGWATDRYMGGVRLLVRRSAFALVALGAFYLTAGQLFAKVPGGFLPDEDQGAVFVAIRLPDGASLERTMQVSDAVEQMLLSTDGVEAATTLGGVDRLTQTNNSNVATVIGLLRPWEERGGNTQERIIQALRPKFAGIRDAIVFPFGLPPILGLGAAGGFELMIQDRGDAGVERLNEVTRAFIAAAAKRPEIGTLSTGFRATVPQYRVELDTDKAQTLGVPITDVYSTLQTFLGGLYVNDFNRFGRTWRVMIQGEPEFRRTPEDIAQFYVRTAARDMVPLSTLADVRAASGPEVIYRYNRYRSAQLSGANAPGYSSGEAAAALEEVAAQVLPAGFDYEWTGTVFQQRRSEGKEPIAFGLASVLVLLFLAALYESWAIPFAVVLAVPLGLLGAIAAVMLRGYAYDLYTQIGIVTLIGLAAKNAILIVEYAKLRHEEGRSATEAAFDAARLRFRPILMTSFAFLLGVLPLIYATGAGAASRRALGTAVFGGMLVATLLAVFLVPVLYVVIQRRVERRSRAAGALPAAQGALS